MLLFDFDGTLVDTADDIVRATQKFLVRHGHSELPHHVIVAEIGGGLRKLLAGVFGEPPESISSSLMEDLIQIYEAEYLRDPKWMPGAENFLKYWQGPKAIVSNKPERFIRPLLEALGSPPSSWTHIVGGDTYSTNKPDPQPFLKALACAQKTPDQAVMIGDGHPDVLGALQVPMTSVAVSFGYCPIDTLMALGAHHRLDHFDHLPKLIESLNLIQTSLE